MIPKKIHQIWYGDDPIPEFCMEYAERIKALYPDYEYKLWLNEDLEKLRTNVFLEHTKKQRAFGYCVDWYRALILQEHGGLYLDIDVEPKDKITDDMLSKEVILPLDSKYVTSNYIIGCNKKSNFSKALVNVYNTYTDDIIFDKPTWSAPEMIKKALYKSMGVLSVLSKSDGAYRSGRVLFIDINDNKYFNHVVGVIEKHFK